MKAALLKGIVFFVAVLVLFAQPVWAKAKGFCYVIGYSYLEKTAFFSPVIVQKVDSTSYNSEEYVSDVELVRSLESQFSSRLSQIVHLDTGRYTVSARGIYKSNAIAGEKLNTEMNDYKARGFAVKSIQDFVLTN
jgi:hypothetical protein